MDSRSLSLISFISSVWPKFSVLNGEWVFTGLSNFQPFFFLPLYFYFMCLYVSVICIYIVCLPISLYTTCMPEEPEESIRLPGTTARGTREPPCRHWELKLCPAVGQPERHLSILVILFLKFLLLSQWLERKWRERQRRKERSAALGRTTFMRGWGSESDSNPCFWSTNASLPCSPGCAQVPLSSSLFGGAN